MPKGMRPITTMLLFDAVSIAASANSSSVAIGLSEIAQDGIFSVHYTITGTGTLKLEYNVCSTKSGTYLEPSTASDIGSSLTAGSDLLSFEPELAPFLKIKATETGGANAAVLTLRLNIQ